MLFLNLTWVCDIDFLRYPYLSYLFRYLLQISGEFLTFSTLAIIAAIRTLLDLFSLSVLFISYYVMKFFKPQMPSIILWIVYPKDRI